MPELEDDRVTIALNEHQSDYVARVAEEDDIAVQDYVENLFNRGLREEQSLSIQLKQEHGRWGEHPDYPHEDWAREASKNATRLGYWEWVANQIRLAKYHP